MTAVPRTRITPQSSAPYVEHNDNDEIELCFLGRGSCFQCVVIGVLLLGCGYMIVLLFVLLSLS